MWLGCDNYLVFPDSEGPAAESFEEHTEEPDASGKEEVDDLEELDEGTISKNKDDGYKLST